MAYAHLLIMQHMGDWCE